MPDYSLSIDEEWERVRHWREEQLQQAGVAEFAAFRLAMAVQVDLHLLLKAKKDGLTDEALIDLFID